jgi:large subunit ribosomal protein L35
MSKMKTHRGSAKRFKRTGTGKLKRFKAFKSHLTGKKSPKRIRNLRKSTLVSAGDTKRINHMIP